MRGVGGVDDIDRMDAAAVFLADAAEHPLGPGAFDSHGDAGIFRLECAGNPLGKWQVHRRVPDRLALLAGCGDQRWRHGFGRRCGGADRCGMEWQSTKPERHGARTLQHVTSGDFWRHLRFPLLMPVRMPVSGSSVLPLFADFDRAGDDPNSIQPTSGSVPAADAARPSSLAPRLHPTA
jgi:hypothetical protein